LVALRGGYHFTDRFELEGQVEAMLPDCADDVDCGDIRLFLLNGQYKFRPGSAVQPYVLFGAGWSDFTGGDQSSIPGIEDPFEGQLVVQVGAGSRFYFGRRKRAAFRLEVSSTFFEDTSNANAQVGLLWRLGKGS